MAKFYAGIGSRQTPPGICELMTRIAVQLEARGYILRSGGAKGADRAFESGAQYSIVLRPEEATPAAMMLASNVHPAWHACNGYARKLHARNCMIILGRELTEPAEFVICWQDPTIERGGTRLGMKLAAERQIPVYNLAVDGDYERFLQTHLSGG